MKDQMDKARDAVDFFKQTLGAENFFLELQNHGIPEQAKVNSFLIKWSKEFGLKLVATNDVHYINKSDSHAHDCLVCIGTQDLLSNPKRMSAGYVPEQFFLRSAEEMKARFAETGSRDKYAGSRREMQSGNQVMANCIIRFFIRRNISRAKVICASCSPKVCSGVTESTREPKATNLLSKKSKTRRDYRLIPKDVTKEKAKPP